MNIVQKTATAEKIIDMSHKLERMLDPVIDEYPDAYYHIVGLKYDWIEVERNLILGCLLSNFVDSEEDFIALYRGWASIANQVGFYQFRQFGFDWELIPELPADYARPAEWEKLHSDYCRTMRGLVENVMAERGY